MFLLFPDKHLLKENDEYRLEIKKLKNEISSLHSTIHGYKKTVNDLLRDRETSFTLYPKYNDVIGMQTNCRRCCCCRCK